MSLLKEIGIHSEGPDTLMMPFKGKRGNRILFSCHNMAPLSVENEFCTYGCQNGLRTCCYNS